MPETKFRNNGRYHSTLGPRHASILGLAVDGDELIVSVALDHADRRVAFPLEELR